MTFKLKQKNGVTIIEKSVQGSKVRMSKRSWGLNNARTLNEFTDWGYFVQGKAYKSICTECLINVNTTNNFGWYFESFIILRK